MFLSPLRRTLTFCTPLHTRGATMSDAPFDRNLLSREASWILEALLGRADDRGEVQISTSVLASVSGLSQGALARGRSELVSHLLLREAKGYSANGLRGANVYTLNLLLLNPPSVPNPAGEPGRHRKLKAAQDVAPEEHSDDGAKRGLWARLLHRN